MAEFNARKLSERLEQLNREQRAAMEKLVEELLKASSEGRRAPKRADPKNPPSRTA